MSEEENIEPEEIPEQSVNNPSEETTSSDELIADAEQRETNNEKQETTQQKEEDMEVHHHTHPAHGKKTWKAYFWEFLMLFLAVFCGFLAEWQLEHVIEHQREKKFAKQMLADLRADSVFFAKRIPAENGLLEKHQQFYDLMTGVVKPSDKEVLNKCLPLLYVFDIQATTATYSQMKTSGGLRYIQNEILTNVLQQYYEVLLPRAIKGSEMETKYYSDIITPFQIKHFRVQDIDNMEDSVKVISPVIMDRTAQTDQELLNIIDSYGSLHRVILERLNTPTAEKLNELIVLLKKEYHLE